MQPFRFHIHAQGAELSAEIAVDLLRSDRRRCLEADSLAICAAAAW